MALNHLVADVAIRCASRGFTLCDLAERFDWNLDEVLAFLRCEKLPSREMLRDLMVGLDLSPEEVERLLKQ
ncbi:MAG TPA: hypothetical protein VJU82_00865 [Acidobacteriaceae bacterium]|nr:hypothetical protein [Acidobacteriaceae bacterium]